ncbi:hypothetical protein BBW65_03325 [Helicobacter enhydrae]|uniref:histidine kinase n=1 Tax=Helicobacter enhydrae TaxID=222136 RepID=A0A1B1U556_9HELI|nr:HAMP domain-containing sensor histidine kinase [Helicobacter enhydrae]ANV97888.1 hypothetical protein BBW65_03325 [Helicobacter enhydrae]
MSEAKKTTFSILALYILSNTFFLCVLFSVWYFGELNTLKTRSFHDVENLGKKLIYIAAKRGKYRAYTRSLEGQKALLQSVSLEAGFLVSVFDVNGTLLYSNMKINPKAVPLENGIYIIDNHAILTSFGRPNFERKLHHRNEDKYRIIIDGGDIATPLWQLRVKVWGLFCLLVVMMSIVGFFLVRLALKPLHQKIQDLDLFIKDSTHEINTPVSILQMSVSGIDVNQLNDKDKKRFSSILIAAKTLESIYDSLIYTTFGQIQNQSTQIPMQQLITERLEFFEILFAQKNISISSQLAPLSLDANPKSITLVLDNLLSNAYKYTPKNGLVQIALRQEGKQAILTIQDNGYGIKEENLPYIFHRFQRFDRSKGGFGLGLNIIKQICDEFHIHISCTSQVGQGSVFTLTWDLRS